MLAVTPAKGGLRPGNSFEVCFPIGIIWGLLGLSAEFAIGFVQERTAGTLLRLRVAPFSRFHILAGNGLACFTACIGVTCMLLAVGHLGFGVRIQNLSVLIPAILSIACASVGLTMMLSVLGKTESAVGGGSWAILLILAMLGGGMVPQMFMPNWMLTASDISPVKWAILALEGGIWRDFTVRDILRPCAVLIGEALVFATIGISILYRNER
jgi:ABC-2 type transport system permease protein